MDKNTLLLIAAAGVGFILFQQYQKKKAEEQKRITDAVAANRSGAAFNNPDNYG